MKPRRSRGLVAWAAGAVLALGGCSAGSGPFGKSDTGPARDYGIVRDWSQLAKDQPKIRAVQTSDLVAADGRCAGEATTPSPALNFQAGPSASRGDPSALIRPDSPSAAVAPRGIGLGMTECEVVSTAGHTDNVEISATESGGRKVVLTYMRSDHADVYQFEEGRLRSVARMPQPQAPDKVAKPRRHVTQSTGN